MNSNRSFDSLSFGILAIRHSFFYSCFVDRGLGYMAVCHDSALFVDEEACSRQDLAFVFDVSIFESQVFKISLLVDPGEVDAVAIR